MVGVAQLVESRIVIPVVAGSNPVIHPIFYFARVVELVDTLDLGSSAARRESSSLSSRTKLFIFHVIIKVNILCRYLLKATKS